MVQPGNVWNKGLVLNIGYIEAELALLVGLFR